MVCEDNECICPNGVMDAHISPKDRVKVRVLIRVLILNYKHMKTIEHYEVAGKVFNDKEKALKYEAELRNNLNLRARNLKVFYWKMLGYPGISTAIDLINHFCKYHKLTFGQYKGKCIGEIIMLSPRYIRWCIKNVPFFKMNKEEEALLNTSWEYSVGGTSWNITFDEVTEIEGDRYSQELIDWEIQQLYSKSE